MWDAETFYSKVPLVDHCVLFLHLERKTFFKIILNIPQNSFTCSIILFLKFCIKKNKNVLHYTYYLDINLVSSIMTVLHFSKFFLMSWVPLVKSLPICMTCFSPSFTFLVLCWLYSKYAFSKLLILHCDFF